MELTKQQVGMTKGVAILLMLLLHLFCRKEINGYYDVFFMIHGVPLVYYLALFGDASIAIYCFCSGYGLMIGYKNNKEAYFQKNMLRLLKLYVNYWIILIIFVLGIGYIVGKSDVYPGNLNTFFLAVTAVSPSYNGAWWFLTTYIMLVLCSPLLNKIVIHYNYKIVILCSVLYYFIAYVQKVKGVIVFDDLVCSWFIRQLALFGTSQFPFIVGGVFANKKIYSQIYNRFQKLKFKNVVAIYLIFAMILFHSFIETAFLAPFIGIPFTCLFNLIDKPNWLTKVLSFLQGHSTNIWLTHMFFYITFFKELVFYPRYPVLIFPWLVMLCVAASYVIQFIYRPIAKRLDNTFAAVTFEKTMERYR